MKIVVHIKNIVNLNRNIVGNLQLIGIVKDGWDLIPIHRVGVVIIVVVAMLDRIGVILKKVCNGINSALGQIIPEWFMPDAIQPGEGTPDEMANLRRVNSRIKGGREITAGAVIYWSTRSGGCGAMRLSTATLEKVADF